MKRIEKMKIENLCDALNNKSILNFFAKERITWKNIVEKEAWLGGFY